MADNNFKISIVGSDTLLGRELQEVIKDRATGVRISEYSSTGEGNFAEQEGEAVYLEPLGPQAIAHDRALLVAGTADGALKAYELVKAAGGRPLLIDCVGHLDQMPEARILAPLVGEAVPPGTWLVSLAQPPASALALVLKRLRRIRAVRHSIANIFEPASDWGKRGISELHQQTNSLLAFKSLEKELFDAQLSFNLLARFGEDAAVNLTDAEQRMERHLAALLSRDVNGSAVPMPSLRLIQAPVFHGYSISLWVEFEKAVEASEIEEGLASAQIEVRQASEEPPNSVAAAGQSGLIAGDIRIDRNNPRAAWSWIVCDNLRLIADAAADVVNGLRTVLQ